MTLRYILKVWLYHDLLLACLLDNVIPITWLKGWSRNFFIRCLHDILLTILSSSWKWDHVPYFVDQLSSCLGNRGYCMLHFQKVLTSTKLTEIPIAFCWLWFMNLQEIVSCFQPRGAMKTKVVLINIYFLFIFLNIIASIIFLNFSTIFYFVLLQVSCTYFA